ncbi:tetratricopeptide repeat protein [Waterburya agarophytonicola K14]|uniref:Tetratricopeptide repeat protein n=1 Tax=Waterburya agarophytonicola KI4 TaxID=2874699 RepID=A0A964FHD6_9CYAN|nr:tetratricopeptide repeat protein [Waterburya agarophytonicola]MCC0177554.1 tetratricopeptide repeat protein [Waterburya agarophytonicola KI4]
MMNTNHNSSTLSARDNKSFDRSDLPVQSLALIESSNQLDRPTQEQKKSIALIYTEQALVYCQEHNWRKAILACKNALELDPNTADAYKILGDILYRQGKEAEALGVYAKALTINPNSATVYANLGTLYADRQDWHKALDYYQQAIILDPNAAIAYRNLAQVWEELGDTDQALECLCQAINLDPSILAAEDYFDFGKELYQQGKLKEASILYVHGIQLNPKAEAELGQLVQIFEELSEWQQAVVYYHQLISLPESKSDRQQKSQDSFASWTKNKPIRKLLSNSKSKSSVNKIVAKNTQSNIPFLPQNLAQELIPKIQGKSIKSNSTSVDQTTPNTREKLQEKPDSPLSWNNLGSIYAQKKQWTKAISCYQKALELEPNFAKSYRNLARVYSKTKEQRKAVLCWYEAFAIEPNIVKPEEYFSLAQKLLQFQQQDKAIACLRRTIELKSDFEEAHLILNKLVN